MLLSTIPGPAPPIPSMSPDGGLWNPANWAQLVYVIGVPAFFVLVLFGLFIWYLKFDSKKWDTHLNRLEELLYSQLESTKAAHQKLNSLMGDAKDGKNK